METSKEAQGGMEDRANGVPPASWGRHVGVGAVAGAAAGLVCGVGEGLRLVLNGFQWRGGLALTIGLFYAVVAALGGLLAGAMIGAYLKRCNRPVYRERLLPGYFGLLLAGVICGTTLFLVNTRYLEDDLAWSSLGIDLLIILGSVTVGAGAYGLLRAVRRLGGSGIWVITALVVVVLVGVTIGGFGGRAELSLPRGGTAGVEDLPNVILIVIDALRADHLSGYGYSRPTSPHLDGFFRNSAFFERALAQSSWTLPATGSILTSLYPSAHGAYTNNAALPLGVVTAAEILGREGYVCGGFSANGVVSPIFNFDQGFDYFYYVKTEAGLYQTALFKAIVTLLRIDKEAIVQKLMRLAGLNDGAQDLNKHVLEWLSAHKHKRFFLYIHYMDPHDPYTPPPPYDRTFDPDYNGKLVSRPPNLPSPFDPGIPLAPDERHNIVAQYDGEIRYADAEIGRLFRKLKEWGLYNSGLIVVTADHGEEFYEHRNWLHGHSLYNELIHVPLAIRYPAAIKPGRTSHEVGTIDILPTVLEYLGLDGPEEIQGRSLKELVDSGEAPKRPGVYSDKVYPPIRALTRGDHKVIVKRNPSASAGSRWTVEVYDLANDPGEQYELTDSADEPLRKELCEQLEQARQLAMSVRFTGETARLTEAQAELMKAHGYMRSGQHLFSGAPDAATTAAGSE